MERDELILVRGAGDLGTGIAHALVSDGRRVLVLDRPLPTCLRLTVAFAAAALEGQITVLGVEAVHCHDREEIEAAWASGRAPLWTSDPTSLSLRSDVLVDARMRSLTEPSARLGDAQVVIGVGPGFTAGVDAHYVIESNRGPDLGRVLTSGCAERYTGQPGAVLGYRQERLLIAPRAGMFTRARALGDVVAVDDVVGAVDGEPVRARLAGMIRGLKLTGVEVGAGHKIGDVDPREDPALLNEMTDKARAIGRGVLDALALARASAL